mmetsp:Transcript_95425/g.279027  ORF Transcript_95425/g.279027 Transcript_95425/m.279027 type:complete len:337 (+) Transcript_95425:124-1134(+)
MEGSQALDRARCKEACTTHDGHINLHTQTSISPSGSSISSATAAKASCSCAGFLAEMCAPMFPALFASCAQYCTSSSVLGFRSEPQDTKIRLSPGTPARSSAVTFSPPGCESDWLSSPSVSVTRNFWPPPACSMCCAHVRMPSYMQVSPWRSPLMPAICEAICRWLAPLSVRGKCSWTPVSKLYSPIWSCSSTCRSKMSAMQSLATSTRVLPPASCESMDADRSTRKMMDLLSPIFGFALGSAPTSTACVGILHGCKPGTLAASSSICATERRAYSAHRQTMASRACGCCTSRCCATCSESSFMRMPRWYWPWTSCSLVCTSAFPQLWIISTAFWG